MPKHVKFFLFPFILLIGLGVTIVLTQDHGFFVLWLNEYHTSSADFFFRYWTYIGDGLAVVVVFLTLLTFMRRHAYVLALLGITLAGVSAFLKQIVFGKVPRPAKYFEGNEVLDFVEGVKVHHWYSFPSGHTMTAFVLAVYLLMMTKKPHWSLFLLITATFVGVSRMYLNLHFLKDVLAGAIVGTMLAWFFYWLFRNYLEKDFYSSNQNS